MNKNNNIKIINLVDLILILYLALLNEQNLSKLIRGYGNYYILEWKAKLLKFNF